jgi:osmotically-inducible protein OsmY
MEKQKNRTDAEIQQDVARELDWDSHVSPTEVGVQVKHGVVTLSGNVDSWAKVRAAREAAHRVAGVLDVANDLMVRLPGEGGRSDTDVALAVRRALEWDVTVPEKEIRSTVSRGVVTLEGTVRTGAQRIDAERAIERLVGVTEVVNRLEINPAEKADPVAVRSAVESALERHAAREASQIDIAVSDGIVTVRGYVEGIREREAVLGAIRGTRGVRSVSDQLQVR